MAANLMKTMELSSIRDMQIDTAQIFGKKIGLLATLFGCSHPRLSRPFSHDNVGYRTCINCGAKKKFDLETRTTSAAAYYPGSAG